jgi:hypothetical protein
MACQEMIRPKSQISNVGHGDTFSIKNFMLMMKILDLKFWAKSSKQERAYTYIRTEPFSSSS